jgi:hypothetical protein
MSRLRIIFDGVIAIGPAEPEDGSPLPGPLFAIMPRGTRQISRRSRLKAAEQTYIPVHVPILFTAMAPLANVRPPDDRFRPASPTASSFNIWYPIRERLRFQFDDEDGPGDLTYQVTQAQDLVAAGDVRALADMREIWRERSRIRGEILSHVTPMPPAVASQVIVPRGRISSGQYGRAEGAGEKVSFLPPRTLPVVSKPTVPELIVTVELKQTVHILSYSLETGEKLDRLSFDVPSTGGDIYVGNGDPGDVRMVIANVGQQNMTFRKEDNDHDFELYYPLLEGDDDGEHLPIPHAIRFGTPHCYTLKVGGGG